MKKKDLQATMIRCGWWLLRQGANHEIWTNGDHIVPVPRHVEVNHFTARNILRKVEKNKMKQKTRKVRDVH
jgi:mRNA interferase HicA